MKKFIILIMITLLSTLFMVSCSKEDANQAKTDSGTSAAKIELTGTPIELGGVTFTPPGDWTDFGPSGMRQASYAFGPVGDETDSATVTVFFFGPGQGGSISANLERWVGQMAPPSGMSAEDASVIQELQVNDMPLHLLQMNGSFTAGSMMGASTLKKDYRMVGVVLEAPEGNIFYKLTGPLATAETMEDGLMAMMQAITKN